jgi:NMD protein affecting ribosome stability and mRNA decay
MIRHVVDWINQKLIRHDIKCPCGAWKIFARRSKIKLGEIIFEHTSKSYPVEVNLRTCSRCGWAYQHKNRIVKIKDAPTPIHTDMIRYYDGEHRESN